MDTVTWGGPWCPGFRSKDCVRLDAPNRPSGPLAVLGGYGTSMCVNTGIDIAVNDDLLDLYVGWMCCDRARVLPSAGPTVDGPSGATAPLV